MTKEIKCWRCPASSDDGRMRIFTRRLLTGVRALPRLALEGKHVIRLVESLGLYPAAVAEFESRRGHAARFGADENPPRLVVRKLLEAERQHHRFADHRETRRLSAAETVDHHEAGRERPINVERMLFHRPDGAIRRQAAHSAIEFECGVTGNFGKPGAVRRLLP